MHYRDRPYCHKATGLLQPGLRYAGQGSRDEAYCGSAGGRTCGSDAFRAISEAAGT